MTRPLNGSNVFHHAKPDGMATNTLSAHENVNIAFESFWNLVAQTSLKIE